MYEYKVTFNLTGGGRTQEAVVTLLKQVNSNFSSKELADAIERQFGQRPANVFSHEFLGKK